MACRSHGHRRGVRRCAGHVVLVFLASRSSGSPVTAIRTRTFRTSYAAVVAHDYRVSLRRYSLRECFPLPFVRRTWATETSSAPARSNTVNSFSRVVLLPEKYPIGIDPFEQPINGNKVHLLDDNRVHLSLTRHGMFSGVFGERGVEHCGKILGSSRQDV